MHSLRVMVSCRFCLLFRSTMELAGSDQPSNHQMIYIPFDLILNKQHSVCGPYLLIPSGP